LPFEPVVAGDTAYWVFLTISLLAAVVAAGALALWFILAKEEEAGDGQRPTATRDVIDRTPTAPLRRDTWSIDGHGNYRRCSPSLRS
jgi:hypothetical protein